MLRGKVPPKFSITAGRSFHRALILPCSPFAVHFPCRALLSRGICSATLSGVVSRFIPRSIDKNGQTFCVDACASVLD